MAKEQRQTAYLVYRIGGGPEHVVLWDTRDVTIGRLDTRDIVVPDAEVSREHAVLRKQENGYAVEDLGSSLGTQVNDEPIKVHQLQHGDTVRVGSLTLRFGLTKRALTPGGNVRWASQLKDLGLESGEEGRTQLGFKLDDDLVSPTAPTVRPLGAASAKAVSMNGTLEDLDEDVPLATGDYDDLLVSTPVVRDLDEELGQADTPAPAPTGIEATATVELEVKGPAARLEALLQALLEQRIQIPPFEIRLRNRKSS